MICCNQASPADFGFAKMLLEKLEEGDYAASTEQIDDRVGFIRKFLRYQTINIVSFVLQHWLMFYC